MTAKYSMIQPLCYGIQKENCQRGSWWLSNVFIYDLDDFASVSWNFVVYCLTVICLLFALGL